MQVEAFLSPNHLEMKRGEEAISLLSHAWPDGKFKFSIDKL